MNNLHLESNPVANENNIIKAVHSGIQGNVRYFLFFAQLEQVDFLFLLSQQTADVCPVLEDGQTAHEDAAKRNPQEGYRTVACTENCTEDGACAGNVKKLDEEDFPSGHGHVIHSVCLGVAWCLAIRVNPKNLFYKSAIDDVT